MSEPTACVIAFIVITIAAIILFNMARQTTTSGYLTPKEWRIFLQELRRSETRSEKLFIFFSYTVLVMKTSFTGSVVVVVLAGYVAAPAVCNQGPLVELLQWATELIFAPKGGVSQEG